MFHELGQNSLIYKDIDRTNKNFFWNNNKEWIHKILNELFQQLLGIRAVDPNMRWVWDFKK